MSMTSNSAGYARHMDEVFAEREEQDYSYEEYQEWCHLNSADPLRSFGDFIEKLLFGSRKQERPPADDVQPGEQDV